MTVAIPGARPTGRLVGLVCGLLLALGASTMQAQDSTDAPRWETWPELDLWVRLNQREQLFFPLAVSRAREVDYLEGLVGVHYDRRFNKYLSARAGYRYLWALLERGEEDRYREHRFVAEVTPRTYVLAGIKVYDRSRFDLRSINGEVSWRYRNRVRAERVFEFSRERALTPYAMVEIGYDSRYDEFNRVRLQAGGEYQFSPALWLDLYYVRQWDDQSSVPRLNAIGVAVNLAFCSWCSASAPAPKGAQGT